MLCVSNEGPSQTLPNLYRGGDVYAASDLLSFSITMPDTARDRIRASRASIFSI